MAQKCFLPCFSVVLWRVVIAWLLSFFSLFGIARRPATNHRQKRGKKGFDRCMQSNKKKNQMADDVPRGRKSHAYETGQTRERFPFAIDFSFFSSQRRKKGTTNKRGKKKRVCRKKYGEGQREGKKA